MPNKNKASQLAAQRRWYRRNKSEQVERSKHRRVEIRTWVNEYKSTLACCDCGENDPACLDFHHTDPKHKDAAVGWMANQGYSRKRIMEEVGKCIVVCANCHRKRHQNSPVV